MEKQDELKDKPSRTGGLQGLIKNARRRGEPEDASEKPSRNRKGGEAGDAPAKPKLPINPRSLLPAVLLVLGLSLALSAAAVFALDLAGWRSSVRNALTDILIGKEKQVIQAELSFAFEDRVAEEISLRLADERAALADEKTALDAREAGLLAREAEVARREAEAIEKLNELEAQREAVEALEAQAEQKIADINQLCALYEAMEPERAASIMEQMEVADLLIKIIFHMQNEKAAAILEVMEKEKAADILSRIGS